MMALMVLPTYLYDGIDGLADIEPAHAHLELRRGIVPLFQVDARIGDGRQRRVHRRWRQRGR